MQKLSQREKEVLEFFSDSTVKIHSNKILAERLHLKEGTVKVYICRLTKKLNTDRIGLALQPHQLILDLQEIEPPKSIKETPPRECKKTEVQKIRNGGTPEISRESIAAPTPGFRADYKYKSLRPNFLETP